MKPVVAILALIVFVSGETVKVVDGPVQVVNGQVKVVDGPSQDVPLEDHPVFGYMARVGIPLAEKIRKAEEAMLKNQDGNQTTSRVVGGLPAAVGQFPWQAGLITDIMGLNGNGVCGGTLVSETKLLTAAHCWNDGQNQAWRITVVLGSTSLFSGGMRLETSVVAMHPSWSPLLVRHDIAVIYLSIPVPSSSAVAPILLPFGHEHEDFGGEAAIVSGYGITTESGSITNTQSLHYAPVAVIRNSVCRLTFPLIISEGHLCTSGAGGVGACGGDSGGPLTVTRNGKSMLIAITSFSSSEGCGSGKPAGYTRVSTHLDFLRQHVEIA